MQARTIHVLTIALSAALLSPMAMAQDQSTGAMGQASTTNQATTPPTTGTMSTNADASAGFGTLDANGDGRISATEAKANASLSGGFASMDADHDGYVSNAEYSSHMGASGMKSSGSTMGNADWSDSNSSDSKSESTDTNASDSDTDSKDKSDTPPTP